MNEELFRNKLMISSPTSISLGHTTWFALDTKLVGRVKALLEEKENLQSKIDKANELLEERKERVEDISWVEIKVEDYIEEINEIEFILKEK